MLPIRIRPDPAPHAETALMAAGISPIVARCLAQRGVEDATIALLGHKLLSYRGLKGIREMALGLADAIQAGERMVVVADYDCDGATACAVAVSGLKALGADIDFVVPNRLIHGYGLTPSVVDVAAEKNPRWIITVDNGIASVDGVAAANARGIGVWVTDHHLPGPTLPEASGIVNPNQPECPFPSKNLAGVGVMFYVLAATRDALRGRGHPAAQEMDVSDWLDIVALGTVADVVRLDENNRWLVNQGLLRIRRGHMRPGVAALFHVSKKDPERACAQDFGFGLGPRLNAAGRLDDMSIGIRCLLSEDPDEALELAEQLHAFNEERKNIESDMKEVAWATLELEKQRTQFTRVVFGPDFHEGVIGIVAGRIKEQDYAPTIVFAPGQEPGIWKGSGRSIPGLHLRDAIDMVYKDHPDWFVKFGGHAMAAGLTIRDHAKDEFPAAFEEAVRVWFEGVRPEAVLLVDGALSPADMTIGTAQAIAENVWGQGFEEPLWLGEFKVHQVDWMGAEKNHMRLTVSPLGSHQRFKAIQFFQKTETAPQKDDVVRLAYRMQVNIFRENVSLDILIADRD